MFDIHAGIRLDSSTLSPALAELPSDTRRTVDTTVLWVGPRFRLCYTGSKTRTQGKGNLYNVQ